MAIDDTIMQRRITAKWPFLSPNVMERRRLSAFIGSLAAVPAFCALSILPASFLHLVQLPVLRIALHQLRMGAPVHDASAAHDEYLVGIHYRGEPLADDDLRQMLDILPQRAPYLRVRSRIDRGCRVIEDEDPRILQQRPGDAEPLALAAREVGASLVHMAIEAILHR